VAAYIESLKELVNFLCSPSIFLGIATLLFFFAITFNRWWTKPKVAAVLGLVIFGGYFLAVLDPNFREIVKKPDNVPITIMLVMFAYFLWFAMYRATQNDIRMEQGLKPIEAEESEQKVLVWPDLVYSETVIAVACLLFLLAWGYIFEAPLEEPANSSKSPNPAKAPWYFLGLQEMLVYFDPWIAGVVLPGMIISGLIALPYVDINKKGNGYYCFKDRKFAISVFLFGFVVLWVVLIFLGTFLRGPNWYFFGPFEYWDSHRVIAETNINLSEIIYIKALGVAMPSSWILREIFGFVVVIGYLAAVPALITAFVPFFRKLFTELGFLRYSIVIVHLTVMMALPIKMLLRWFFNLKYIVFLPEFFFNI